MKSHLHLIARGLFINNQKLGDLLFKPLTRKHERRGDAFSKSLSIVTDSSVLHINGKKKLEKSSFRCFRRKPDCTGTDGG